MVTGKVRPLGPASERPAGELRPAVGLVRPGSRNRNRDCSPWLGHPSHAGHHCGVGHHYDVGRHDEVAVPDPVRRHCVAFPGAPRSSGVPFRHRSHGSRLSRLSHHLSRLSRLSDPTTPTDRTRRPGGEVPDDRHRLILVAPMPVPHGLPGSSLHSLHGWFPVGTADRLHPILAGAGNQEGWAMPCRQVYLHPLAR